MIQIPIGKGRFAIVDDCDMEFLYLHSWNASNRGGYVVAAGGIYLHVEIGKKMFGTLTGEIDHEDRNKLNCCRSNLRQATPSQNSSNVEYQTRNSHGYKGVTYHSRINRYSARIQKEGKRIPLGCFDTAKEAAAAYNQAAKVFHGEFACLNNL